MKRWFFRLTLVAFLGAAMYFGCQVIFSDPISRANFDKLQVGMSEKEVEGILGPAPLELEPGLKCWNGSEHYILVFFDLNNLVVDKEIHDEQISSNLWQRILEWLGFPSQRIKRPEAA